MDPISITLSVALALPLVGLAAHTLGLHRRIGALQRALEYHSAPDTARVLVVNFPFAGEYNRPTRLLQRSGWQVREVTCSAPADRDWMVLLPETDVLILCGQTQAENEALAVEPAFQTAREKLAGVILYTPDSRKIFYTLSLWQDEDQGVTTPATCDTAIFALAARSRRIALRLSWEAKQDRLRIRARS